MSTNAPLLLPPSAASTLIGRKTLHDAVPCKHASIDREVSANHECSHGCILLCQSIGLIGEIGLVLSPIHEDEACETLGTLVSLVEWISPSSTSAKTCIFQLASGLRMIFSLGTNFWQDRLRQRIPGDENSKLYHFHLDSTRTGVS